MLLFYIFTHKINPTNSVIKFKVSKKCQENVITLVYTTLQNVNILSGHSYRANYAARKLYYKQSNPLRNWNRWAAITAAWTHYATETDGLQLRQHEPPTQLKQMGCNYCSMNPLPHVTLVDEFMEDMKTIHPKTAKKFPTKNLI